MILLPVTRLCLLFACTPKSFHSTSTCIAFHSCSQQTGHIEMITAMRVVNRKKKKYYESTDFNKNRLTVVNSSVSSTRS